MMNWKQIVAPLTVSAASVLILSACGSGSSPQTGGTTESTTATAAAKPIKWGGDEAGGAPYVYRDPNDPKKLLGFEVEIMDEVGKRLGRPAQFVQSEWPSLIPSLNRGDFDVAFNGIEVTPDRVATVAFSKPYYVYSQQLVIRKDDNYTTLSELVGKKVGTLAATAAERILLETPGIEIVRYDDNTRPYDELVTGRLDAVLLDLPLAVVYGKPKKELKFAGVPFAEGFYAGAFRQNDKATRDQVSKALEDMIKDGSLRKILAKYELDGPAQDKLPTAAQPN
jgi:polar amino acid transport system substrate-binding protein